MLSFQPKKIAAAFALLLIASASIFIASCQKELSGGGFNITETPPDLTTKIAASVSGFVTDETDAAVNGATVQFGNATTTTDKYGYFEFSNEQAVKNAAVVTVLKPGYFKGIKTYIAAENKSAFFRIKLLPKTNQGSFNAATGGTVTLTNGLAISFPVDAVQLASGGTYTGQVSVAAQWINPVATDLNRTMPGDLRGLDSLGFIRNLTTYGMAAVELTGTAGELLQIATAKKATLTFPIPAGISSSAPSNLPLWSFNETNGLWKQEGYAIKSGSNYVGDVSHFSYWNCDVPANFVQFNCTVKDAAGNAVAGALVKVTVVSEPQRSGSGYTDSSGYTGGAVPNNAQLKLEVFGDYSCSTPIHSQNFTTDNQNISLGVVTVPITNVATVSGNVIDCAAAPVANGFVIMVKDGFIYRFDVNADGTFSFTLPLCNSTASVQLLAEDITTLQAGNQQTETLVSGNNAVGALSACGTSIDQFINYSINGTSYSFVYPTDSITHDVNTQSVPPVSYVSGGSPNSGTSGSAFFSFTQNSIVAGTSQALTSFYTREITDSASLSGSPLVNITEYGNVGEYIAGNFNAVMTSGPPANTTYNITCQFRVRRRQ